MKKTLSLVLTLCMVLSLFATFVISASADDVLTWEDGWVNDPADDKPEENGQNILFNNAYGYTFALDADGHIDGEDNIVVTASEAYLGCNPNWAVSVLLKPAGDLYEVVAVVMNPGDVATNGMPADINFDNGNIVLVAHSAYSNDLGANYTSKLCALALKVGDKVKVSETEVYVLIPESGETVVIENQKVSGITYTTSQLFRQNNSTWSWDENCEIAYPDSGNELFDGVFAPTETHHLYDANAGAWMGFHAQCPDYEEVGYAWIKLDLGKAYDLTDVALYTASSAVDYANATVVTVRVSADGNEWADFGSVDCVDDASVTFVKTTVSGAANARYVEIRMTTGGGWLGVCEAEVFADVAVSGGSTTIKEEITVDGDVSDTGWAKDKWISVNADNGTFQGGSDSLKNAVSSSFSYKFQMRADETKLYVAAVYDCSIVEVDDNGRGTKFRLWIHNGDEACVAYTHFYDIYMKNGEIVLAAKENFPTAEKVNNASNIENSTLVGAMKEVDGKTYFEMSVDLAEFDGAEGFNYFFNAGHKTVDGENVDNIQMLYPAVPVPEDSKNANFPYTKWYAENDAVCDVEAIKLGEVSGDTNDNLGDAGIYAIAALALVALVGTAVVIKKRA